MTLLQGAGRILHGDPDVWSKRATESRAAGSPKGLAGLLHPTPGELEDSSEPQPFTSSQADHSTQSMTQQGSTDHKDSDSEPKVVEPQRLKVEDPFPFRAIIVWQDVVSAGHEAPAVCHSPQESY
ncbi:UNVERIFIED_CONTAM: hypothetical protein K2H54_001477 [Gekko kuhli]